MFSYLSLPTEWIQSRTAASLQHSHTENWLDKKSWSFFHSTNNKKHFSQNTLLILKHYKYYDIIKGQDKTLMLAVIHLRNNCVLCFIIYKSLLKHLWLTCWLRSIQSSPVTLNRFKSKTGEAVFWFSAAHLWNKLPKHLRSAPPVSSCDCSLWLWN